MKPWKHAEFWFTLFCCSLLTASYLNGGGFTPRIALPDTPPEIVNGAKFWKDLETMKIAERYGLEGTAAYLVQKPQGGRYSVIAFPNGFVQMRGSREENLETLQEIKRGVELARKR